MKTLTVKELAGYFDHTLLKAFVTNEDFKKLCDDADKYGFKMVAINSAPVALCKEYLKDSPVHVGAAISFPLGQTTIETKVFETKNAIENGADEIDYVINIVELKNKNYDYIKREMEAIVAVCRENGVLSKVIFENCYLTLDLNKLEWSDRLLEVMGIDREKMPALLKSTDVAGTVTDEAAKACGLVSGIPVVCGGGDGVCAAVGTGCTKEGIAHSCMGTSSWISITTEKPIYDEEMRTFTWAHIVPGYVLPTGTMQCGGGSYSWFTKELCKYESLLGEQQGVSKYDLLEQEIGDSKPGANGLLFLPYLIGERSPRWNPKAKGAFIGLKMETEKKDMVRAVQEGVAFNLGVVMDVFKGKGVAIDDMIVIGGGAQSDAWLQILADVYNINIQKPNYLEEATSMGAAITAGVGVGVFENFDVIDKFLKIEETKTPNTDNQPVYSAMKPIFDEAYFALTGVFDKLSEFTK